MSNNVFDLVYSSFDWEEHHFLEGPEDATVEDFQKICDQLLPKAGYRATLKYANSTEKGWIYWSDVVESLISLLEEQGYQRVSLDDYQLHVDDEYVNYFALDERLGFAGPLITAYNKKYDRYLKEKRKTVKLNKKKPIQIIK